MIFLMKITIFTDGASRGNPGPGGWGAVKVSDAEVREFGGSEKHTTNNRMEIQAAIAALQACEVGDEIVLYTDSSYLINGITKWVSGWKRNGWITKTKEDVMNKDLWMELDAAVSGKKILWTHVGGHIGSPGNERCDEIATSTADGTPIDFYSGPLSDYSIKNILDVSHDEAKLAAKKSSSSRSRAQAYSYVSAIGGVVQTHATWAECEKRVKGARGARFKKSLDAADEGMIKSEFSRQ
jgi:ribonuclease HI